VLLNDCTLVRAEPDRVTLAVSDTLLAAAQASEKDLLALLAAAWDRAVTLELKASSSLFSPPAASPPSAHPASAPGESAPAPGPGSTPTAAPAEDMTQHPLVKHAITLFGARLVGVQPRKRVDPSPQDQT
jgi:hypothetical protein